MITQKQQIPILLTVLIGLTLKAQLSVYPGQLKENGDSIFGQLRLIDITGSDSATGIIQFEDIGLEEVSFHRVKNGIELSSNGNDYTCHIGIPDIEDSVEVIVVSMFHTNFTDTKVQDDILVAQTFFHVEEKFISRHRERMRIKRIELIELERE